GSAAASRGARPSARRIIHDRARRQCISASLRQACRMKPTIAFFGSSLVSAYWNGAATYYRGVIRALAERGFSVTFYEPDAYDRQQHRDIPDPHWATVVVYPAD